MRVLVVVHGFPPSASGGSEIYAHQHACALVRLFGDEVHVLTREQVRSRPEYEVRTEARDSLHITWVNNTFRHTRSIEESYRNDPIRKIAVDLVDEFKPHVAHVHHLTCLSTDIVRELAARRIPIVFTLHDYWLLCHRGQLLDVNHQRCRGPEPSGCQSCLDLAASPVIPSRLVPTLRAIERRLPPAVAGAARRSAMKVIGATPPSAKEVDHASRRLEHMTEVCSRVTHFLAPSRSILERFISFGIPGSRISLAPYGFDRNGFGETRTTHVVGSQTEHSLVVSPIRLGFVGSLMVSKAPHLLLEAHRRMPAGSTTVDLFGAHADYHGDTSYAATLSPLLAQPGVRLHGPRPHNDIPGILGALDALVVPSIWPETSPLVIREAFLAGIPVIASDIGGIPELVEHGANGLLVQPGDADDLRRALTRLVEEPGLLAALKAGVARTDVRSLDDDVAATRLVYQQCVSGNAQASSRSSRSVRGHSPLAAVVLNYRTPDDTALAVSSLLASSRVPDQVVVVDNDEEPGCRARMRRFGAVVTYWPTGRNLGFSGGMNEGIRVALGSGAERVLLVNSDVIVAPDCITQLEKALESYGQGIVGPLVMSRAFPGVVASGGIDYNQRTGRMLHRGVGEVLAHQVWTTGDRTAVSGCLMLISREVFERVGLFDERYFFSFEEIDICLRAAAAGFPTRLIAGAVAFHEGGRTVGDAPSPRLYFAARNHLLLAKSHGADDPRVVRTLRTGIVTALNLAHAVRMKGGSPFTRLGAVLRGTMDFARGRFGPGPVQ